MMSSREPLFDRKWLILVLAVFVGQVALFAAFSTIKVPADQANSLLNDTKAIVAQMENEPLLLKALDIFLNNVSIALREFVPVLGWYIFYEATLTTGQIISSLAVSSGVPVSLLLITTFLSPHSYVEFMAYAVAVTESFLLAYSIPMRRLRAELPRAMSSLALAVFMLLFAALLESISIQYGFIGYAYAWGVLVLSVFPLYWLNRRLHWPAPAPTPAPATA
ncbi:MAG: stage II sporulation protein M [Conexivisphaerales archaeon]|jgi:uncharacterized membrane protein SpoIIM required for sporulation